MKLFSARLSCLLLIFCIVLGSSLHAQTVYYLRPTGNDANTGKGSWNNAFASLAKAVSSATSRDTVLVAAGTYKTTTTTDKSISISLVEGVKIFGGFPATGNPTFTDRNLGTFQTVFSGDLNGDNLYSNGDTEFFFRIVGGTGQTDIDGVQFQYSKNCISANFLSNYENISLNNVLFRSAGFGINNTRGINHVIATNCTFLEMEGGIGGAFNGMDLERCIFTNTRQPVFLYCNTNNISTTSYVSLKNCHLANYSTAAIFVMSDDNRQNIIRVVAENTVFVNGSYAIYGWNINKYSRLQYDITGCTFTGHSIALMHEPDAKRSTARFRNNIVWNNSFPEIFSLEVLTNSKLLISNSNMQGRVYPGAGNTSVDPLFVDPVNLLGPDRVFGSADDGLHLKPGSPLIDAGLNAAVTVNFDALGQPRITNSRVDLGAYESPAAALATLRSVASQQLDNVVNNKISVLSNPFTTDLTITVNSERSEQGTLALFDVSGRRLFSRSLSLAEGTSTIRVPAASIRPGTYLLSVETTSRKRTMKVIKR